MNTPDKYIYKNMYLHSFPGICALITMINNFCCVFFLFIPFTKLYVNLTKFGVSVLGPSANQVKQNDSCGTGFIFYFEIERFLF